MTHTHITTCTQGAQHASNDKVELGLRLGMFEVLGRTGLPVLGAAIFGLLRASLAIFSLEKKIKMSGFLFNIQTEKMFICMHREYITRLHRCPFFFALAHRQAV